jgi:hypothetical protein
MMNQPDRRQKIHIPFFGWINPIEEWETVAWAWDASIKNLKQSQRTKFWLDLKERMKDKLLDLHAYELLSHIDSKITVEQERRRDYYRKKVQRQSEAEAKAFEDRHDKVYRKARMMQELMKMITDN